MKGLQQDTDNTDYGLGLDFHSKIYNQYTNLKTEFNLSLFARK